MVDFEHTAWPISTNSRPLPRAGSPFLPLATRFACLVRPVQMGAGREGTMKPVNLEGRTFGRLGVLRKLDRSELAWPLNSEPSSFWRCACRCGTWCVVRGSNLTRGITRSCGCMKRESLRTMNTRRWGQRREGGPVTASPALVTGERTGTDG